MQSCLKTAPVSYLVAIEVSSGRVVVSPFAVFQLFPPLFSKRVYVRGARVLDYVTSLACTIIVNVRDHDGASVQQSVFVKKDIFVRHTLAELFFKFVADSRAGCCPERSEQRRANHAKSDYRPNTGDRQRRRRKSQRRATRSAHCAANRGPHRSAPSRPL